MEKARYIIVGFVFGMLFGTAAAVVHHGSSAAPEIEGTVWTRYHAAIPSGAQEDASPTF